MGLLDTVLGSLLGGGGGNSPLQAILGQLLNGGGLNQIVGQLRQAGLGPQVDSWIGTGPNQPVSPDALHNALGHEQVQQWAQQTGMDQGDLLHQLSSLIPHAIDHATPTGTLPATEDNPFDGPGMR